MKFVNRSEAAELLLEKLISFNNCKNTVIVAIPNGGVVIGAKIATALNLPLELVLSKKIKHPINKKDTIGAVSLKSRILSSDTLGVSKKYIENETQSIKSSLHQQYYFYYGNKTPLNLKNKVVILVDDGIITGNTFLLSLKLIKQQNPLKIIVAVPVANQPILNIIKKLSFVTYTVCLLIPLKIKTLTEFYEDFKDINDIKTLKLFNNTNSLSIVY